jgi:hypothetical protein
MASDSNSQNSKTGRIPQEVIDSLDQDHIPPEKNAQRVWETLQREGIDLTIEELLHFCTLALGQLAVGIADEPLIKIAKALNNRVYSLHYNTLIEQKLHGIHEEAGERPQSEEVPGDSS